MTIEAREEILQEVRMARDKQEASLANERSQSTFVVSVWLAITSLIITLVELPRILNSEADIYDEIKGAVSYLITLTLAFLLLCYIYYCCHRRFAIGRRLVDGFIRLFVRCRRLVDKCVYLIGLPCILFILAVLYPTWFTWLTNPSMPVIRWLVYVPLYAATIVVGGCWVYAHRVTGKRGEWQVGPDLKTLTDIRDDSSDDQAALLDSLICVHSKYFEQNENQLHHVRKATATQMLIVYIALFVLSTVITAVLAATT